MMKGVPPVDARPPPKVRASIEFPSGVNPYAHYATAGYPWGGPGFAHPYVPYGRRGTKRMSMAALPYPAGKEEEEVSLISSEQEETNNAASKVTSHKSQVKKHRPSTAMAPGVYPYRYGYQPSMTKSSTKRLSKLPTEKWNGFTK